LFAPRFCPVLKTPIGRVDIEPAPTNLRRKHRVKPVPAEPDRLVADVDTTLEQKIFDLSERQREPGTHHHRQAGDLR